MTNDRTLKIAALRGMIADLSLPVEVRHQAAAQLAELLPSDFDQALQFVALLPAEVVEQLADWLD